MRSQQSGIRKGLTLVICAALFLLSVSTVRAGVLFYTDSAAWEAAVTDIEVFETTAENVALAEEVNVIPAINYQLGPVLTFEADKTGLTASFIVETLQAGEGGERVGFTFNETEDGAALAGYENALSVGDNGNWEDDDWALELLDGASMTAFGVEIRQARFASGETLTIYSGDLAVGEIDLSALPDTGNEDYFLGIISDVPFDSIGFDEDPDEDDIAIADFRFASLLPDVWIINAVVDMKPERLNLRSRGKYVTAYIELPDGYDVNDIDMSSVVISKIRSDVIKPPIRRTGLWRIGDYDGDGVRDLRVRFSRKKLIRLLKTSDRRITIAGTLLNGTSFTGTDKIRTKCNKSCKRYFKKYKKKYKKYRAKYRH